VQSSGAWQTSGFASHKVLTSKKLSSLYYKYHIVIFHFLFRNNYNGLLNPDPPLKSTTPFGAKITRANSTLETAPPPLFLDPISQSGSAYILYYLLMLLM
jgi:hypothetical protein